MTGQRIGVRAGKHLTKLRPACEGRGGASEAETIEGTAEEGINPMTEPTFFKIKAVFFLTKKAFDKLAAVQAALEDCMRLRVNTLDAEARAPLEDEIRALQAQWHRAFEEFQEANTELRKSPEEKRSEKSPMKRRLLQLASL